MASTKQMQERAKQKKQNAKVDAVCEAIMAKLLPAFKLTGWTEGYEAPDKAAMLAEQFARTVQDTNTHIAMLEYRDRCEEMLYNTYPSIIKSKFKSRDWDEAYIEIKKMNAQSQYYLGMLDLVVGATQVRYVDVSPMYKQFN